jgi:ATP-dependent DNA helicase UvrD/PcrA
MMRDVSEAGEDVHQALGRGVIVAAGAPAPAAWSDATRVTIDDETLRAPAEAIEQLQTHWSRRIPVVVDVRCDASELRAPQIEQLAPHALSPRYELARERLYFLIRANNYDGRHGSLVWGPSVEARRLGATASVVADVALPDGTPAWCDGGPRAAHIAVPDGHALLHRNNLEHGVLVPDRAATTGEDLAADQLEAVLHDSGPARVIAPAGSGKTRVLTARLRLLIARGWAPSSMTAVAYNVRAKDAMRARLDDLPPGARNRIRTLHALGNDVLRRARGSGTLIDEWELRRRVEALVPVKPRANTDVYAPYLEALGEARLGLVDPQLVETRRDDVAGFGAMFDQYREKLQADGALDHDEQIYGAIEVLLREPAIRRAAQTGARYLLVDEFQDLTPAQLLMLRLVAAPAYDVFGVGDDDQVIYGHAGADPEFLINYDQYFPGGTHHALATNYRCPGRIVVATSNLLSYSGRRIGKQILAAKPGDADDLTIASAAPERIALAAIERATAWLEAGAAPEDIAVLARVNSALLPVQVLFDVAHVPCWTPVSAAVLNRTGTRTALAYLRLAVGVAASSGLGGGDVAAAARRPSRSLRREVLRRFERRQWRIAQLRATTGELTGGAAEKLEALCDDLEMLGAGVRDGATTADLLVRIRDDVGLGTALTTFDLSGKRPEGSHRDDLNALIAVASIEPDPTAFEPWLRARLRAPNEPARDEGVAVSTVHRVKGMEWPYVVVLGAHEGLMPHALADDIEEERRVFHVAITRADTAVHIVADRSAPAPFIDELQAPAPADYKPRPQFKRSLQRAPTAPPMRRDAGDPELVTALKQWRRQRAASDKVPAFVVLSDAHLNGIAARAPATLAELARCAGIGPTKLERYGDEIVAVIADPTPRT